MDCQITPARVYYRFEEIDGAEADAGAAIEMAPASPTPRRSIFTDDTEKVGFWRRQFGKTVSRRQRFWDWAFGVVMPLMCFYFDPIVFREWSGGEGVLLAHFQLPVYILAYGSIMALAAWLLWGDRLGPFKLAAGFVMAGGAVMSSILAVILFPFALVGSLFIIGVLGFTPIFTSIIYWRNAARALRGGGQRIRMKRNIVRIPSVWLPIFMSAIVIAAMVWHLARFGLAHQTDEGTAAHLFQILMPLQIPFIGYFALRWMTVDAHWAVKILTVQIGLFALIFAVVFFFLDR